MTWEDLERLPEELAEEIELWDGRPVWLHRAPGEHSEAIAVMWRELARCWSETSNPVDEQCLKVRIECNVFFGAHSKNDFATPDFLIHHCLDKPYQDIRGSDVVLVGEVLSRSNRDADIEGKKARYAAAGIAWYWEVTLDPDAARIAMIRASALQTGHAQLPPGVSLLRETNYLLAAEWTSGTDLEIDQPFPIRIPWSQLTI